MSVKNGEVVHTTTGARVAIYRGWSWPAFFFGAIWFLAKGMIIEGLVIFIAAVFTGGIAWLIGLIVLPLVANSYYAESLAKRGYVSEQVLRDAALRHQAS